jgi:hypothetical protein
VRDEEGNERLVEATGFTIINDWVHFLDGTDNYGLPVPFLAIRDAVRVEKI